MKTNGWELALSLQKSLERSKTVVWNVKLPKVNPKRRRLV